MNTAFVLGAGLGTRLRPLTESLPKPLIPVCQKPLVTYAFDHLLDAGFSRFIVNTHHVPDAWPAAFSGSQYRGAPIEFRFEPVLLETAGGIANIADLLPGDEPFLVYNGDILTDLPIAPALAAHRAGGHMVTLVLRSAGHALQLGLDAGTGKILDIHNRLGTNSAPLYQFTGIYVVEPEFLAHLTPGKKESVIPIFLDLIQNEQALGGVVVDGGSWWDLGNRDEYLAAHAALADAEADGHPFPLHGPQPDQARIHPTAVIEPGAQVCPHSSLGKNAVVEAGATVLESVLWEGAKAAAGSSLKRCILVRNALASGQLTDADIQ